MSIENQLKSDAITILSPIVPGLDTRVRDAVEGLPEKKARLVIILHTLGGIAEVVERMVKVIRNSYDEVTVVVPDRAMSAGTILALSADNIMMNYFSCLGSIDPQIEREGKLVPALSYLNQFERLNEKAEKGQLTTAEYALLSKLDLGELYQFEQAKELSIELLIKWLSKYKFKNWDRTESTNTEVTLEMKKKRAKEIADSLNDTERWHSHGRGIDMNTLSNELQLKIDNYAEYAEFYKTLGEYFKLLDDYMQSAQLVSFIHTREYF